MTHWPPLTPAQRREINRRNRAALAANPPKVPNIADVIQAATWRERVTGAYRELERAKAKAARLAERLARLERQCRAAEREIAEARQALEAMKAEPIGWHPKLGRAAPAA